MKKSINAMSKISEKHIDELKDIGKATPIRRRSYRTVIIAATLAVMILSISLFAIVGSNPPPPPDILPQSSNNEYSGSFISDNISSNESVLFEDSSVLDQSFVSDEESMKQDSSFFIEDSSEPNDSSIYVESSGADDPSQSVSGVEIPNYNENGAAFTAQQMADIFSAVTVGDGTKSYQLLGFDNINKIKTGSLPEKDLSIIIEKDWEYAYKNATMGGIIEEAIYLDGKTIIIPIDATYEEVYSIAVEWLPHCQKIFGFDYGDIQVKGGAGKFNFYEIYYYDASASYPYCNYGSPIMRTNSYFRMEIGTNTNSDVKTLRNVLYKAENNSFVEGQSYNTISLEEAEIMLENGYVFGGHTCPLCMAEQDSIDFSDYDLVGIEYVERLGDDGRTTNELFPFYAFYKKVKEGSYARTYVPAFRVSGLEEYFESRKNIHE